MRFSLIAAMILAGTSAPVLAQRTETVEQRLNRVEGQLRAVQRRVFPNGTAQFVQPEIGAQTAAPALAAPQTNDAMSNLSSRVDAFEAQLRTLTGQVEEQGYRSRQLEQQINQLRTDLQARTAEPPAPTQPPAESPPPTGGSADAA